jgi:hypothetical protein
MLIHLPYLTYRGKLGSLEGFVREENDLLPLENFIHQRGQIVLIRNGGKEKCRISCESGIIARRTALTLAGVTEAEVGKRKNIYLKNLKHPWHGILILDSNRDQKTRETVAVRIRAISDSSFSALSQGASENGEIC